MKRRVMSGIRLLLLSSGALFALLFLPPSVAANPVPEWLARVVAENYMTNHVAVHGTWNGVTDPRIVSVTLIEYQDTPVVYNVVAAPSGHLLVAYDDQFSPVLLYSDRSAWDPGKIGDPQSVESWIVVETFTTYRWLMGMNAAERTALEAAVAPHAERITAAWARFTTAAELFVPSRRAEAGQEATGLTEITIGPLLKTTWSQGSPYNMYTPGVSGSCTHTVTGCVATATAQLMKYWNWPTTGTGSHSYSWNGGTLSADFNHPYYWWFMPNALSASSTSTEKDAVARLMSDVGIAFDMDYGCSSSGAYTGQVTSVLPSYFRYRPTILSYGRDGHTAAEFFAVIRADLDIGRPLLFRMSNTGGSGHAVVADGYQTGTTDLVHINLGWGGSYNGYYDISNNWTTGSYTWVASSQVAFYGIVPDWSTAQAPTVTTGTANGVQQISAGLTAQVDPNAIDTYVHFEYGTTTSYGSTTPASVLTAYPDALPVQHVVTGLGPCTLYHFRAVATNIAGMTTNGADARFTTRGCPAPTVTGVSPNIGPRPGGTAVTITGTNFMAGASSGPVYFGAFVATSVDVISPTQLTARTPAGQGTVDVRVMTVDGSGTLAGGFRYVGLPSGRATVADFDGDGDTDLTVFRPGSGEWLVRGQLPVPLGALGDVPAPADYNGDLIAEMAVFRPASGIWTVRNQAPVQWGGPGDVPVPGDYNGDGQADMAVFRPSTGTWHLRGVGTIQWGTAGDIPVPADYNGDRIMELAVFRPSTGTWYVRGQAPVKWGGAGDIPVPADYDGDFLADIAVFRPSTGTWYTTSLGVSVWGTAGDVPAPVDYNGDGSTDLVVYRPSTGTWYVRDIWMPGSQVTVQWGALLDLSVPRPASIPSRVRPGDLNGDRADDLVVYRPGTGTWYAQGSPAVVWGAATDVPVPGDYNGDAVSDIAVYRPSAGTWYLRGQAPISYGQAGDIPVPGDYDGSGTTDIAVFRPSTGVWHVRNQFSRAWGAPGDIPAPGDYDGDGVTDIAVFRPSTGTWYIWNQGTVGWGVAGDIPVPGDYNGDGRTEVAVFRPSAGLWCVLGMGVVAWGAPGDIAVPGDYNADGVTEVAVYRPSAAATWLVRSLSPTIWGTTGDVPAWRPVAYVMP